MDILLAQVLSGFHGDFSLAAGLFAGVFSFIKTTMQVLTVVLFLALVWVLYKFARLRPYPTKTEQLREAFQGGKPVSSSRLGRQWQSIRKRLDEPNEAEWKVAVIEADNLVNDVLRRLGYQGETFAEKLKGVPADRFQSIDAVWDAHRIRNNIVHDPDARMMHRDAREAIANFEAFLKETHLLEE